MHRQALSGVIYLVLFAVAAAAQTNNSMPSKSEVFELVDKADQKVSAFEDAVKDVKPRLDAADPKLAKHYLDAAATAHATIQALHKNGPSAYGLVALLATLDDLSLDAANGSVQILGQARDGGAVGAVFVLSNSGTACNDIAELIMHATLRFVRAEEDLIQSLPDPK